MKQAADWEGFDKFLLSIGKLLRPMFSAIARNEQQVALRELRRVEFIHDYIGNELAKARIMIVRRGWDTTEEDEENEI